MHKDFPELVRHKDLIGRAIANGQSAPQICDNLRRRGIRVTTEQVSRFCESLEHNDHATPDGFGEDDGLPPRTLAQAFPELAKARPYVEEWIGQGMTSDLVWACVAGLLKINTKRERVQAYFDRLFDELYPAGPIQARLFEIKPPERTWNDEDEIIGFGDEPNDDTWKISDLCQGTAILGAPGSGKTSGSGRMFCVEMLKHGFGGLVLTAKNGEADNWMNLCVAAGRGKDMAVVRCGGPLRLNLLQYEAERPGLGAAMTTNLVAFFHTLLSAVGSGQGQGQRENGDFWRTTGQQLLANLVETFLLAKEPLTLDGLCEFITGAPMEPDQVEGWQDRPFFGTCLKSAESLADSPADKRIFAKLRDYWLNVFPNLAPNTRSCVTVGFTAMSDILRGRLIYDLISTRTTCTPEMIMSGKIVIIDLPVSEFRDGGVLVQCAWKYILQRALLCRKDEGKKRRPVFIWEDEGHNTVTDYDNEFQAVSREYRVARVLISQNLNNFYAKFGGGEYARVKVDSLMANINTRIFHANGDLATNKWASESFGTEVKTVIETTSTPQQFHGMNPMMAWFLERTKKPVVSTSTRVVREAVVQPHAFQSLAVGTAKNGWITQAIITQVGRKFCETGRSFGYVVFQQQQIPEIQFSEDIINETKTRMTNE